MKLTLNPDDLPTMKELIAKIVENGGTDAALAKLREEQHEKYHNELIWRYPISQGDAAVVQIHAQISHLNDILDGSLCSSRP